LPSIALPSMPSCLLAGFASMPILADKPLHAADQCYFFSSSF